MSAVLRVPRLGYGEAMQPDRSFEGAGIDGLRWGLGMTGKCLRFGARFPSGASAVGGAEAGAFFEGLWEGDLVELFLAPAEGEAYLELNLAPNAAWWACGFSGVRQRDEAFELPPVSAHRGEVVELWIDVRGLAFPAAEGLRGNVTAIIGGVHASEVVLGGEQPDFHRPSELVPLELA